MLKIHPIVSVVAIATGFAGVAQAQEFAPLELSLNSELAARNLIEKVQATRA